MAHVKLQDELNVFKSLMKSYECSVYWKNHHGVYLGHNEFAKQKMQEVGLSTDIIGKTDYELFSRSIADMYRKNDLYVMDLGAESIFEEYVILPSKVRLRQLSIKLPLYDENDCIYGVIGMTYDITRIHGKFGSITLSRRETQVLACISYGLSAKQIAEKLNLSVRTIETYIMNLKSKFGISKKSEFVEIINLNKLHKVMNYYYKL